MQLTCGKWADGREKCEEHSNKSLLHFSYFLVDKKYFKLKCMKKKYKKRIVFCFVFSKGFSVLFVLENVSLKVEWMGAGRGDNC